MTVKYDANGNHGGILMKKYKLRCFRCRWQFKTKEEVKRNKDGWPLCEECFFDSYNEEEYDDRCPNTKDDQDMIDEHHLRIYGEY